MMQDSPGSSAVTDRILHPEFSCHLEFSGLVQKKKRKLRKVGFLLTTLRDTVTDKTTQQDTLHSLSQDS